MIRKFIIACAMGGLMLGATACNTVKGAGKDIQSVGQAGSDAIKG
ncbi:entericidin A/B family lipoprotein [Novosphingobium lentum]|nr:entericidin A/B family lipoprotein [Novosphingobium lentum]